MTTFQTSHGSFFSDGTAERWTILTKSTTAGWVYKCRDVARTCIGEHKVSTEADLRWQFLSTYACTLHVSESTDKKWSTIRCSYSLLVPHAVLVLLHVISPQCHELVVHRCLYTSSLTAETTTVTAGSSRRIGFCYYVRNLLHAFCYHIRRMSLNGRALSRTHVGGLSTMATGHQPSRVTDCRPIILYATPRAGFTAR